jgi:hypothetical protein
MISKIVGSNCTINEGRFSFRSVSSAAVPWFDAVVRTVSGSCHHLTMFSFYIKSLSSVDSWSRELGTELPSWKTPSDEIVTRGKPVYII